MVRYTVAGALDAGFNGTGTAIVNAGGSSAGRSVFIQDDGKIVIAGYANNDFVLIRLQTNGALDTTFGTAGIWRIDLGGVDAAYAAARSFGGTLTLAGKSGVDMAMIRAFLGDGTEHIVYDSFGNIISATGSLGSPRFSYTGREWDADAGLFYYRARWYDAANGRFISIDPMGFAAGDTNLYRYVGNGPVNAVDPWGLQQQTVTQAQLSAPIDVPQSGTLNPFTPGIGPTASRPVPVSVPVPTSTIDIETYTQRAADGEVSAGQQIGQIIADQQQQSLNEAWQGGFAYSNAKIADLRAALSQYNNQHPDGILPNSVVADILDDRQRQESNWHFWGYKYDESQRISAYADRYNTTLDSDSRYPVIVDISKLDPESKADAIAYTNITNAWLKEHGRQQIKRTKGDWREQANAAIDRERIRHPELYSPATTKIPGHAPDTAITGEPDPRSWLPMTPAANVLLGGVLGPLAPQPSRPFGAPIDRIILIDAGKKVP